MDFYVILGIDRGAAEADIKRAYRRLSRRYHPGVNPGDPRAASLFAQITEAYETLSDPERRQRYDRNGVAPPPAAAEPTFTGFDFSAPAHGAAAATFTELFAALLHPPTAPASQRADRGPDLHATVRVSFAESVTGVSRELLITRYVRCSSCGGSGERPAAATRCGSCHGSGTTHFARGHMTFARPCTTCGGSGRRRSAPCGGCGGHGRVAHAETLTVAVPAGIADNVRLRIAGRGHAGTHGGDPGDADVLVRVDPHPLFSRQGDDIVCTLPIAVHEAVLGARVELPLFGQCVKVTVPPGTQGGARVRVRGRGFPTAAGAGDLVVEVRLVLPEVVDERSRELIREFGRLNQDDVRKDLHGRER
jgi:molecular chaperone DnaJ